MGIPEIFIAVIMANIATLSFLAGVVRSIRNPKDKPAYLLVLFPCFFVIACVLAVSEAKSTAKRVHTGWQSAEPAAGQ